MDDTQLEKVVDGRVFTGRQAIDLKLIDQIGDEKTAVTWLVEQKGVKKGSPCAITSCSRASAICRSSRRRPQ